MDSLLNKGLTKSALEVVNGILEKSKTNGNNAQIVKALIYRIKLNSYLEEDNYVNSIYELQQEADHARFPVKQVLYSITAEIYWRYFENNRWKFYDRTQTVNFKREDIRTWDLKSLLSMVVKNYNLSLQSTDSLQHTPISTFDEVLIKYEDSRNFRPTLYDFLAHRAVDFFMNTEPEVDQPTNRYEVADNRFFGDADEFESIVLSSKDSLSMSYHAAEILQQLTAFHLNDVDPAALIDVEIKRLGFASSKSISELKDSLYMDALKHLMEKYKDYPGSADAAYYLATAYDENANKYNPPFNEEHKWDRKKALEICKQAIKEYPDSHGSDNCKYLVDRIKTKDMKFDLGNVQVPGKPFLTLLSYRNIGKVYYRIAKADFETFRKNRLKKYDDEWIEYLRSLKVVKEWEGELENEGDFQQHKIELANPATDKGFYVLLAGSDSEFSYKGNAVAYKSFWSSDISYFIRNMNDGTYEVRTLNRTTGEPMEGVTAKLYYEKYNYALRAYDWKKYGTYITNQDGYFKIPATKNYRNFYIEFTKEDDELNTEDTYYQYSYSPYDRVRINTHFFTDRAIYRPGQIIYFKGIVIETDGEKHSIKTNYKSTVVMYDVNYQKVGELQLTTNEYGTFSGTFTAPTSSLNGQMHITNNYGSVYFRVEEYKRPKFEIKFNPVVGSFKLDDSVKVEGNAIAYAGAVVDGAKVRYHVVRNASFPFWGYWRGWYPTSPQMEIAHGVITTNEKGAFNISFKAVPDKSINRRYKPQYTYTITADVTDINGETHSAQQVVVVGYNALNISVNVPDQIEQNGQDSFKLKTFNLMGVEEPASGRLIFYHLEAPKQVYRKRDWERPDKFSMTKAEHSAKFPNDVYDNENNVSTWKPDLKVYDKPFDTKKSDDLVLHKLPEWKPGYYKMEATCKDKYGEEVKMIRYIRIYSSLKKEMPVGDAVWFVPLKKEAEPEENVEFMIGSADKDVYILYEIELKNKIIQRRWINLNEEQRRISIPVKEEYRGNFAIHLAVVKNNRPYTFGQIIIVPYSNKKLDIEFETFRNKLYPGQDEEWKVKIKGPKGEKVASEMLAALYDASLDAIIPNMWNFNVFQSFYSSLYWQSRNAFGVRQSALYSEGWNNYYSGSGRYYDYLNWFGYDFYGYGDRLYRYAKKSAKGGAILDEDEEVGLLGESSVNKPASEARGRGNIELKKMDKSGEKDTNRQTQTITGADKTKDERDSGGQTGNRDQLGIIKARSNFNETAFFYPHLTTDEDGNVTIKFTIPEALTRWKFMGLAHTKDLKSAMLYEETVTQKDLMITPNVPRFFRENDQMTFTAKISNLTEKEMKGNARLSFFDAFTMKPIDKSFMSEKKSDQVFTAKKGQSALVQWNIRIPEGIGAVVYKVVAKSGKFSDGEESAIPVLTNRMLVTESMPMPIRGNETKTFTFRKLLSSGKSSSLKNHKLTLEFTSNPAWYAIQALPYLMEYPYECSEQTFSRFYANSIASHIANSHPKVKYVFDSWKIQNPEALLSNLEKNQELKSLMLEETPWVLDAKNETERKKRIGLLFDLNRMSNELGSALLKLEKAQVSNGGWPWFPGMPESRYITQHIVAGFGHLDQLGVKEIRESHRIWNMVSKAIPYLDNRIREDYQWLIRNKVNLNDNNLGYTQIQYLYARSFFTDISVNGRNKEAFNYYMEQAKKYWLENSRYMQGMLALGIYRFGDKTTPTNIINSLRENAIFNEEMGMYWKENVPGYYWYQAPIEMHSLLIEAFNEIADDKKSVEEMRIWLLKQKQTQDWKTTRATADACYALLISGTEWLETENLVQIKIGNLQIDPKKMDDIKVENGTGYFKTSWSKSEIKPEMGNVVVTKPGKGIAWGAIYWQYFEQLDKITSHKTPLQLEKKLFLEKITEGGKVLKPINTNTKLHLGDKITVRIVLRSDRHMEYVHLKDMRAAGFEPENILSRYKYQDGLGYYESSKDASTNFFIEYLPKGTYVFEYSLRVTHKGDFSNGISTIQCMYAPEFTSHSEGIRVIVSE